jgi:LysR family hydrogen peroxide-inducible transcriptional activator
MTLTELKYLVNLDKERHFGRAAARSFVSQPTLSVALKKLEDQLGQLLFERHRGEARPTPLGARIIAQARRVLEEAARLEDLAREGRDELSGALRLGAIYTVGPYLLPSLVPHLRKRAPQMPLVLEENFTAVLLEQLRENELDVIVVALPVSGEGLQSWAIYDEAFVALLPADHRWAKEASIQPRRLAEEPLLLLGPGHCFRDQVVEACPKCLEMDADAPKAHTGSSLETIRHMVTGGLGITVVPRSSVDNRPDDKLLVAKPLVKPAPHRRIGLAWRKSFPRMKAIAALREGILRCGMKGVEFLPGEKPA